jgi:general secretion pathway protein G
MTPPTHRSRRSGLTHTRRAFSLIELLIVIAILLAIVGLVLVNLMPARDQADIDLTRVQIGTFEQAMKRFRLDLRRWPSEDEGLAVLWSGPDALDDEEEAPNFRGPYLEKKLDKDKWLSEWVYHQPSELRDGAAYDIISLGPDREEGTGDDITNHDSEKNTEGEFDELPDLGDSAVGGGG